MTTIVLPHEVPCPQCFARGEVPGIPGSVGRHRWAACPLCRGRKYTTAAAAIAAGWSASMIEERIEHLKGKLAADMLVEEDDS